MEKVRQSASKNNQMYSHSQSKSTMKNGVSKWVCVRVIIIIIIYLVFQFVFFLGLLFN